MILVIAGTKDGREIAEAIAVEGYPLLISVTSEYGRQRLADNLQQRVNETPLDAMGLLQLVQTNGIRLVIDASHPYALAVSVNVKQAAMKAGIPYLRYERPPVTLPVYEKMYKVENYEAAAEMAAQLGQTIFLTTGSRHLATFLGVAAVKQRRVVARVLPEAAVMRECNRLGLQPHDIVALAGPFSQALNMALFREYGAEVIVTKNSGEIGGSDTKIAAAMALQLPIIVLDRPMQDTADCLASSEAVLVAVKKEAAKWNL